MCGGEHEIISKQINSEAVGRQVLADVICALSRRCLRLNRPNRKLPLISQVGWCETDGGLIEVVVDIDVRVNVQVELNVTSSRDRI